jgi:DNA-binding MarR family transcriptional regulator
MEHNNETDSGDAVSLGRLVNEISRTMAYYISHRLAPYELGKAEFEVLSLLSSRDGLEQSQLIELMKSEKYTITKIVRHLQDHSLVEKRHDPEDRRRLHLHLTERGRGLLPELDALKGEITAVLAEDVEFEHAAEVLQQMAKNMRRKVAELKAGQ